MCHNLLLASWTRCSIILSNQYPHPIADAYLEELKNAANEAEKGGDEQPAETQDGSAPTTVPVSALEEQDGATAPTPSDVVSKSQSTMDQTQEDTPDVPLRFVEKKRLHWTGKTCTLQCSYLTTAG